MSSCNSESFNFTNCHSTVYLFTGQPFTAVLGAPINRLNTDKEVYNRALIEGRKNVFREGGMEEADAEDAARAAFLEDKLEKNLPILSKIKRHKQTDVHRQVILNRESKYADAKKISLREQSELEMAGRASELRMYPKIDVDMVICAGGRNDLIRNKFLGINTGIRYLNNFTNSLFIY